MSADQFCFQIVELLSIYMELENEKNPVSIYIVMKYCGENLVHYMHRSDVTLTLEDAAKIVYNIARGLNVWSAEFCFQFIEYSIFRERSKISEARRMHCLLF